VPGRRSIVAVAAAASVVLAACGSSGADPIPTSPGTTSGPVTPALAERVVLGLCRLGRDVERGDRGAAEVTFLDRSHGGLHAIAGALEAVDRAAAGDVLGSKQAVEQAFADGELPTTEQVATLLSATRRGLALLELPVPPCSV
jgi:hypothetical protein